MAELMARASAAVETLPAEVVYAGFSLGAAAAQSLALSRPGARGTLLLEGAAPLSFFGLGWWPAEVPQRVEISRDDPRVEVEDARAMRDGALGWLARRDG